MASAKPPQSLPPGKVDLCTFFCIWAEERNWAVPDVHWLAMHWLEHRGDLAVLRCFRGFGKSTLLAVYNAWRYYINPAYRILHQGDQDKTAYKTSRDTRSVLSRHPLTRDSFGIKSLRGEVSFWWVPLADDERNPSMQAAGITSNITSSRCDEAQNDDVEVPRNIQNPEAREKMRYRLGEQTHCMVPGARQLFVGTPHTHESIYDEMEAMGADCLTIRMFRDEFRVERAKDTAYQVPFEPELVFAGVGKHCALLKRGRDYVYERGWVKFKTAPDVLVDFYAGSAWPERFPPDEMLKRRRKCKTVNEWDSQYQLHSRPLHEVRLDPDRMDVYDVEPEIRPVNGEWMMLLGGARIAGLSCHWDPSGGKVKSDVSSVALVLQDENGCRYWHRAVALTGDVAEFAEDGKTITGGQVMQLCDLVEEFHIPRVEVETNGIGQFAPAVLKAALKQRKLVCGVSGEQSRASKNSRILDAIEGPLKSGMLWAHASVADGPAFREMRAWNPAVSEQQDDYTDSLAAAILATPERIKGPVSKIFADTREHDWRPSAGVHDVELDLTS